MKLMALEFSSSFLCLLNMGVFHTKLIKEQLYFSNKTDKKARERKSGRERKIERGERELHIKIYL